MDEVAGKFSQAKREFATEIENCVFKNAETTEKKERAAELAKRLHGRNSRGNETKK